MDASSSRCLKAVVAVQAAVALAALLGSPKAAIAAACVGLLATARYVALAAYASTLLSPAKARLRPFVGSAWMGGIVALGAAVAAVAVKARPALPWAVAAAVAGPLCMSLLAVGEGIGALASDRLARTGGNPGGKR